MKFSWSLNYSCSLKTGTACGKLFLVLFWAEFFLKDFLVKRQKALNANILMKHKLVALGIFLVDTKISLTKHKRALRRPFSWNSFEAHVLVITAMLYSFEFVLGIIKEHILSSNANGRQKTQNRINKMKLYKTRRWKDNEQHHMFVIVHYSFILIDLWIVLGNISVIFPHYSNKQQQQFSGCF